MAPSSDIAVWLKAEVDWALLPVTQAIGSRRARHQLLEELGWNPSKVDGSGYRKLPDALRQLRGAILDAAEPGGFVDIILGFEGVDDFGSWKRLGVWFKNRILPLITAVSGVAGDLSSDQAWGPVLLEDVLHHLICRYLRTRSPLAYDVLVILEVIRLPGTGKGGRIPPLTEADLWAEQYVLVDETTHVPKEPPPPLRWARRAPRLDLGRFAQLLSGEAGILDPYSPEGERWRWPRTRQEASQVRDRLFPRLGALAWDLYGEAWYARPPTRAPMVADDERLAPPTGQLAVQLFSAASESGGVEAEAGLHMQLFAPQDAPEWAPARGGPTFTLQPVGSLSYTWDLGAWGVELQLDGALPALCLGPASWSAAAQTGAGWKLSLPGASAGAKLAAAALSTVEGRPALRLGRADGSRLELGSWKAGVFVEIEGDAWDLGVQVELVDGELVLDAPDDGFLATILPSSGIQGDFGLRFCWTVARGILFEGGLGLSIDIPIGKTILGALKVLNLHAGVGVAVNSSGWAIPLELGLGVSAKLGPLIATVDRMGIRALVDNTGFEVDFLPPTGVGLAFDAPGLVGGGFLSFEPAAGRYKGMLQVEVHELVSVSVFALLDTKMPDGGKGFSLLGLVFSEFGAGGIQLGFGFTLLGVGGLFGINRGFDVEALQEVFRAGQLDALCFPDDPVAQAPTVFSALSGVFPVEEGRYVFGPFVKLGWGPDAMIALSLGVLIPLPVDEIVILGQLDLYLPNRHAAIVEVHADVLGVLDLAGGSFTLEARLRDSKLLKLYPLKGGFYLLTRWSDPPEFVFSVGGFHPHFAPPAGVPALERLSLSVLLSPIQRLEVQGYFAITSNSFQLGAHVDFYLGVGDYNIHAWLYFDALVYFSPFWFEVDISAGIKVWKFTIQAEIHLEGPNPWYVKGKVVIDLWLFDLKLPFEHRFGTALPDSAPSALDPVALLRAELEATGNWTSTGADSAVRLREREGDEQQDDGALLWPHQPLRLSQKRVPLALAIDKLDERSLAAPVTLGLRSSSFTTAPRPPEQWFARGQFQALSEHDRLTAPAFEAFPAGLELTAANNPTAVAPVQGYEQIEVRPEATGAAGRKLRSTSPFNLSQAAQARLWRQPAK